MVEKDRLIKVTNRDNGRVGYVIEDLNNLHRSFRPGETKELTFEELQKLSWIDGGKYLIEHCLLVDDEEAIRELFNKEMELEYFYTEKEIKELLLGTGEENMNRFLDALDFAPDGVKDMIKELAVSLPCNDVKKRHAIYKVLHYDVTRAIELAKEAEAEADEAQEKEKEGRRVAPAAAPARRYKIVNKT